jgi:hypothetical protein
MPDRTMLETLDALGDDLLDEFDEITREAHSTYSSFDVSLI